MTMDWDKVTPVGQMHGEDGEDTALLFTLLDKARSYLRGFEWCRGLEEEYFGCGVGGVVGVFLFRIAPAQGADEWLWVVVGDLPSAYLVIDRAPDPVSTLKVYCELMDKWILSVREGGGGDDVFPVSAPRTLRNANSLERRIQFIRDKVIPNFE